MLHVYFKAESLFRIFRQWGEYQWLSVNKCLAICIPVQAERLTDRNLNYVWNLGPISEFVQDSSLTSNMHLILLVLEIPLGSRNDRGFTLHNKMLT